MHHQDSDTTDDKSWPFVTFTAHIFGQGKVSLYWAWARGLSRKHQKAFQFQPALLSAEVLLGSDVPLELTPEEVPRIEETQITHKGFINHLAWERSPGELNCSKQGKCKPSYTYTEELEIQ